MGVGARVQPPSKAKKAAKYISYTPLERLFIVEEADASDDSAAIRHKWGVGRTALWRWQRKEERARLEAAVADDAGGSLKRVQKVDPLRRVEEHVQSALSEAARRTHHSL